MHITRLELQNIKSHRDSKYVFERGTTAIVGQNGAGKTTLLEAIAWTLFDLLDYKKDDFVSRGQKKGSVRVAFISGADEREYEVYRDTGTGYYAYDPQLKAKVADKREEVQRFLWLHLGVEPGTDLETLFRRAIGVPQGTFTAIFLETPTERKKAFDKLLKVEEYRQGAEKLLETQRYVESKIYSIREKIARAEGQLDKIEETRKEFDELTRHRSNLEQELSGKVALLDSSEKELSILETKAAKIVELDSERERQMSKIASTDSHLSRASEALKEALVAAESLDRTRAGHDSHLASLESLRELELRRTAREKVNAKIRDIESRIVHADSDTKKYSDELRKIENAGEKIQELAPLASEQARLETLKEDLNLRLADIRAAEDSLKSVDAAIARLRETYKLNRDALKKAEEGLEKAADLDQLRTRDLELGKEIAGIRSSIEYNERFRAEIQKGLCPILSEKCLNLKPGQTLESFVAEGSTELNSHLVTLQKEEASNRTKLNAALAAQQIASSVEALRTRDAEIANEGKAFKEDRERLTAVISEKDAVLGELKQVIDELAALDNPSARLQVLRETLESSDSMKSKLEEAKEVSERLLKEKASLDSELIQFGSLEEEIRHASLRRDETESDHRTFLANQKLADKKDALDAEIAGLTRERDSLVTIHEQAELQLAVERADYDADSHELKKRSTKELAGTVADLRAAFKSTGERVDRLSDELERLEKIGRSLQEEIIEKKWLDEVLEVTTFIRETLKEAAPRVARNYVHHVSIEAAQMFREITGNAEYTLKWGDDYGISLEESGFERPFASLSGGEQMVASLAVRLALLKQMSDIRIAFFDEPTTNMDADRRERLAEQISQITQKQTFEQLFIISHDDTFESYVDNLITVGDDF